MSIDASPVVSLPLHTLRQLRSLEIDDHEIILQEPSSSTVRQQDQATEGRQHSSSSSSSSGLGQLTGLQELTLGCLRRPSCSAQGSTSAAAPSDAEYSAAFGAAIGQLKQLTSLNLSTLPVDWITGSVLAAASGLQQLQRLELESAQASN
jgi:hypothetical protein